MELLPSIQSGTLVEPALRGVHDHEDTISRMGGIGAILAAHRVRFGLRRSLCGKDVAPSYRKQNAKGQSMEIWLPS